MSDAPGRLEIHARNMSKALVQLTVGGSEFFLRIGENYYADIDKCVSYVRDRHERQHNTIVEAYTRIKELETALTAARIEGVREGLERAYAIAKLEEGAGGDFKELLSDLEAIVMADRAAKELPHDHD